MLHKGCLTHDQNGKKGRPCEKKADTATIRCNSYFAKVLKKSARCVTPPKETDQHRRSNITGPILRNNQIPLVCPTSKRSNRTKPANRLPGSATRETRICILMRTTTRYQAVYPPSITKCEAVIKLDASLSINSAAPRYSFVSEIRPIIFAASHFARKVGSLRKSFCTMGVRMLPGQSTLTRIGLPATIWPHCWFPRKEENSE